MIWPPLALWPKYHPAQSVRAPRQSPYPGPGRHADSAWRLQACCALTWRSARPVWHRSMPPALRLSAAGHASAGRAGRQSHAPCRSAACGWTVPDTPVRGREQQRVRLGADESGQVISDERAQVGRDGHVTGPRVALGGGDGIRPRCAPHRAPPRSRPRGSSDCCRALKMSMRASLSVRTNNRSWCAC